MHLTILHQHDLVKLSTPPTPAPTARFLKLPAAPQGAVKGSASLLLRLTLELLVVFVGVYAAFALQEHQKQREDAERRHQLQLALVHEIDGVVTNARGLAEELRPMIAHYDASIAAGARPQLQPLIQPLRVESYMWEATLQTSGLDLLDVPTIAQLSWFYNDLNQGFEQWAQLRQLSETLLLPNLDRGPEEFYDPGTGALRPKYQWYLAGIGRLAVIAERVAVRGDSLAAELRQGTGREAPAP